MKDNAQVLALRKLGLSEEEIAEVLADDKAIDKGAKLFELTDEQKKVVKKMTNSDTKTKKTASTVYKFEQKKTRKENATKGSIIAEIAQFLSENVQLSCELVEITNKERQIAFRIGENDYELTLVQKRKPKN